MLRRRFLQLAGISGSGVFLLSGCDARSRLDSVGPRIWRTDDVVRGFIVSDAHFGWTDDAQPTPAMIREWMHHIRSRFPDLDMLIDTGDATHNGATAAARSDWTDAVASVTGSVPMFVCCGNHDLAPGTPAVNAEDRAADLFQLPCRPYYSFDVKNVHFVVLPQLLRVGLVTSEALAWLELDLALNAERSIVIFSHNAIQGTTKSHGEPWYRQVVNSSEVLSRVIDRQNVLAWMHGHNHSYEIAREFGKLFVSNGRIGGFQPPWEGCAGEHAGGIYFEIAPDRLVVRGYSATKKRFLDELGFPHLSQTLRTATSVDGSTRPTFSYGCGRVLPGRTLRAANHVLGEGEREGFVIAAGQSTLNEDARFELAARVASPPGVDMLTACVITGVDPSQWECTPTGLVIQARTTATLTLPHRRARNTGYYRWPAGQSYQVVIETSTSGTGATLRAHWAAPHLEGPVRDVRPGNQFYQATFAPSLESNNSAGPTGLRVDIRSGETALTIRQIAVTHIGGNIDAPLILRINESRFQLQSGSNTDAPTRLVLEPGSSPHDTVSVDGESPQAVTFVVRQPFDWQVRNAFGHLDPNGSLRIGPIRNANAHQSEIIIAPVRKPTGPWVYRLRFVDRAIVSRTSDGLEIRILALVEGDRAEVTVASARRHTVVEGAISHQFDEDSANLIIRAKDGATIHVRS